MLNQIDGILAEETPDVSKLSQLKQSLQEKLETLKLLDGEILELVQEDDIITEIEAAYSFKEGIYVSMIKIEKYTAMAMPTTPPSVTPWVTHSRDRDRMKPPKL